MNDVENRKNIIECSRFSSVFSVRKLKEEDIENILELELSNPLYYEYCPPFPTKESILEDMNVCPPRLSIENKYYVGYFKDDKLVAVLDLLIGYPEEGVAFIGFFMVHKNCSGTNTGSNIITELMDYLMVSGIQKVRLGYVIGNPQSEHFWKKNGFIELKKTTSLTVDQEIMLMERIKND